MATYGDDLVVGRPCCEGMVGRWLDPPSTRQTTSATAEPAASRHQPRLGECGLMYGHDESPIVLDLDSLGSLAEPEQGWLDLQ
jgi:hypothetical protein